MLQSERKHNAPHENGSGTRTGEQEKHTKQRLPDILFTGAVQQKAERKSAMENEKKFKARMRINRISKWVINAILIAAILMLISCFWPFILMLLLYSIPLLSIAGSILTVAILYKVYKYISERNNHL